MKVKDILQKKSGEVFTVHPQQTLLEASQILATRKVGALVVVDERHTPVGILSERDIVRLLAQKGDAVGALRVSEAMTADVITARPDDDVAYLSSTMTNKRIRHLPVLDSGQMVGIVSIGDVVKAQLDYLEGETRTLQQFITGGYS